ncbi:hypothetical protein WJX73_004058 [Symbiochloris irregularis]|uniref:very-long-chain 3-oxoacyl-CoA synthase n=1 Tax=Symbiochloris irregularis TaxID=706552 RepID=A0AAW1NQ16_9CHLO
MVDECRKAGVFTEENVAFMEKVLAVSGLGERTALSKGILRLRQGVTKAKGYQECLEESDTILMDCVENVLRKTNITADQVDIVIVSCSCFAPTPSMAARVVNRFRMREDVLTYNLSGMGCSSSLICVDMVKHLLQAMPNKLALVLNHENITSCFYLGDERPYLLVNCLFRLGGAAALMSNRPVDRAMAKYDLKHTVRARALTDPSYIPRFATAFEHFLIHTGGRGVLDELEKKLQLDQKLMVPSRDVLHRFGNLSAASTWYILSHIEHYGTMKKGDRIFQLGFGGGFKANSAAWVARRNVTQSHTCWQDE